MPRSGQYEHWLDFMRMPQPPVQDAMGAILSEPVLHFSSWGAFEPAGSQEFPVGYKRHAETTARFRIPYQEITIDPNLHTVVMDFDEEASPPTTSTWNVLGAYGTRFETIIEVSEVR